MSDSHLPTLRSWSTGARWVAAGGQLLATLTLLFLTGLTIFGFGEAISPLTRDLAFLFGAIVPLGLARVLGRPARVSREEERLVLEQRRLRFEIPLATIARVETSLFLPEPTAVLRLASGRAFERRLSLAPELAALGLSLPEGFTLAFAAARRRWHRRDGLALGLKYGVFPLALAFVFFRAHQMITYGGPLGEYRMFGLGHYLVTLFHFEATTLGQLAGIALVLRLLAEGVTLALTAAMPRRASGLRRGAEITVRVVYYAVIPALVVARFLF